MLAAHPLSEGASLEDCSTLSGTVSEHYTAWLPLFLDEINRVDADCRKARVLIRQLGAAGRLPACQMAGFFLYVSTTVKIESKGKSDAEFLSKMKDSKSELTKLQRHLQRLESSLKKETEEASTLYNFPWHRVQTMAIIHLLKDALVALDEIDTVTRSSFLHRQLNNDMYMLKKCAAGASSRSLPS